MEDAGRQSDRELLKRFRAGEREAFTLLYRAHHPAVFRFALYMTRDERRATEITQDVFVWLIHHPEEFDPARGTLPAFLGGVARQLLRRKLYEERRWQAFDEDAAEQLEKSGAAEAIGPGESADLWKAIARLPERYREVVILCDLEEKSCREAADLLGCAVGTVWSRLNRAHELLSRKLESGQWEIKRKQGCSI